MDITEKGNEYRQKMIFSSEEKVLQYLLGGHLLGVSI